MLQKWQLEKHSQMKTGISPPPMRLESIIQAALAQDTGFPVTWPSWLHPGLLCSEKELSGTSSVKSHLHWGCLLLPQVGASWTEDLWDLGGKLPHTWFKFQKYIFLSPDHILTMSSELPRRLLLEGWRRGEVTISRFHLALIIKLRDLNFYCDFFLRPYFRDWDFFQDQNLWDRYRYYQYHYQYRNGIILDSNTTFPMCMLRWAINSVFAHKNLPFR